MAPRKARPGSKDTPPQELARIHAAPARRVVGVGSVGLLGVVLTWVALATPPAAPGWLAFLLLCGLGSLGLAPWLWRVTGRAIILTEDGLFEQGGPVIAQLDEIERVERSVFAFKPSGGFALKLRTPASRAWRPGLWWRSGRRVAVGGMTSGMQTRPVADILAFKVAQRDG